MNVSKINRVYLLSFLFTLHVSLAAYVNSTFLTNIVSEKYVGILYTMAALLTLTLLSESATILKHFGNRHLIMGFIGINILSLTGLIMSVNPYIVGISFIAFLASNSLVMFSMDIFIEHFSDQNTVGRTRGIFLTILNFAWIISPLITAVLIESQGGYVAIYTIALGIALLTALGLAFSVKHFKDKRYIKTPFIETYRELKKSPHMFAITIINFILQFFYSLMVVYTPIYLYKHIGFSWDQIGVIFTIMLVPFILFGWPIGVLIDKYHARKRTLLCIGFIIISLSTFSMTWISGKSIALWALVLFCTRVGASIIETTSEIYFFTHVKEEEAYLLGVFRDMSPVALIIAPLIATVAFVYLPFNFIFAILGVIMLSGLYYIPRLQHDHE
jgi:MFS family permease